MKTNTEIAAAVATLLDAHVDPHPSHFAGIGPSDRLMNVTLEGAPISLEDAKALSAKIDHAIATNDLAMINNIAGVAKSILHVPAMFSGLGGLFA